VKAGELRTRVVIQEPVRTGSGTGGRVEWRTLAPAWADIRPVRSTDRTQEGHFQAVRLARVTIRYREGIKSKMRVAIGSRILEIVSVIDVDERHRQLDLLCEERGV
jgi:SPP1 family predicted phage head-tail adaptor